MMSVLWNPIGVLDIPCSGTWGAPHGGDPRLCCITRTGLNRRISLAGFFRGSTAMGLFLDKRCG